MSAQENISMLQQELAGIQLVAVTKHRPVTDILAVIQAGIKDLGENRLQEIEKKYDSRLFHELERNGVRLHFLGHLQKNKVNKVVRLCDVIQSVDSLELARLINRAAERLGKIIPIFLELNLTGEEQKFGLREEELTPLVPPVQTLQHLHLRGFMCMGKVGDEIVTRTVFRKCRELVRSFRLPEVSMGMSEDYRIAIEEGTTMVRLGTMIFETEA